MGWSIFKSKTNGQQQVTELLTRVAGEVDMLRAIDEIEDQNNITCKTKSDTQISSSKQIYYVSASSDNHREKKHIHEILERKTRSYISDFSFLDDHMFLSEEKITIIILWSHSYLDDIQCNQHFQNLIQLSHNHSPSLRIVFLQLNPNDQLTGDVPEEYLLLPGFDRVSRELAIFKIVEEEHFISDS